MNKIIIGKILIFFICFNSANSKVYEFFKELSIGRPEYLICESLKKIPLKNDEINYIYAPWVLLHRNIKAKEKPTIHDLPKINNIHNSFVVCSHDEYEKLIPFFRSIGIKVIFSVCGTKRKYDQIKIVTIPYVASNKVNPANIKDIFYSFIGSITHKFREKIFAMKHPKTCVIIKRNIFHYRLDNANKLEHAEEYANVLSRSRFSLCPKGNSCGSIRFWESLQAGAIPILISDDYKLPPGFNWKSCIIRVKEKDIYKIPKIVSRISKEKEGLMLQNCLKAYDSYSGVNFDRVIREYFDK